MNKREAYTRGGICLDLRFSDYEMIVGSTTFYFSSMFFADKFSNEFQRYHAGLRAKICKIMGLDILNTNVSALSLYCAIEKRGFYCKHIRNDGTSEIFCDSDSYLAYMNENKMLYTP